MRAIEGHVDIVYTVQFDEFSLVSASEDNQGQK